MDDDDAGVQAISTILTALKPLEHDARVHVLDYVVKRLGISPGPGAQHWTQSDAKKGVDDVLQLPFLSDGPTLSAAPAPLADIRSFATEKSPATVNERVALVAYFLAHLAPADERREFISAEDIKPLFIQAGFQLPTAAPNVTLNNAKNAGYFVALERGHFKLNAVGHNLVAHKLPLDAQPTKKRAANKRVNIQKPAKAKPKSRAKR